MQEKNLLRTVKEYILITLGILIYTCGWTIFLTPNNMFGGGVSGISAIIQYATGIKMGYTYYKSKIADDGSGGCRPVQ